MLQVTPLQSEELEILRIANSYGQHRSTCPFCTPNRKSIHKHEKCLSVKRDDDGVVYNCQHCGVKGSINSGKKMHRSNVVAIETNKNPIRKNPEETQRLEEKHYNYLKDERGISRDTADKYKLFSTNKFFPAAGEKHDAIGLGFLDNNGEIYAAKIRSIEGKYFSCWQSPQTFFGIDTVPVGSDLVIVEGEFDAMSIMESGTPAVSVPNGAPVKVVDGKVSPEEDNKFRFVWAAKEHIESADRVIIAVDNDAPGEALAEELARRIGKDRCWRVHWPEGVKDANEYLLRHGAEALDNLVKNPDPWPIEGLHNADHFRQQITDLFEKGVGRGDSTGYECVDDLYTIVPGQLTVVTGVPSSGKSEFVDQIMVNLAANSHWTFGVCSFENEPRLHIAKLMSKRSGKPFFEGRQPRMKRIDFDAALDWVNEHFIFLHQEDGGLSDLDSILSRLRAAVMRIGIRGAIIDPYNFIERPRDVSETEWISYMLTKLKAFCMAHDIHIWFVAHPTKLQRNQEGKLPVPKGYEISGSAAWFAKADCGLTVHRIPEENPLEAQIHIWKCRFSWVGKQGETRLLYDTGTTRYQEFDWSASETPKEFI
jgi:twinkle protein